MKCLKIKTFKHGELSPEVTISIPSKVLEVANKLIPNKALEVLEEQGIELKNVIELLKGEEANGVIVEIENHEKNEKIVIAID